MRDSIVWIILSALFTASCGTAPNLGEITPPYIETAVNPEEWAVVPAGVFPFGQHDQMTAVDYDYEMMITPVTNHQYARFLNEALSLGLSRIGEVEVEAGEQAWIEVGAVGYYPGDPFVGYKHEEEIKPGEKLFLPTGENAVRLIYDFETFSALHEFSNHPVTMVTWFGANAYCEFYGWRLPTEVEWEKAARGTEIMDGYGLPFPWGTIIEGSYANFYTSSDPYEAQFGKLGSTTPVGFYNGSAYNGYTTHDSASPYGIYDMAGNVWEWTGDVYPNQHYRHMRGGSFYSYEIDLRVWKTNSAGPQYYSPAVGFRCARDAYVSD
jgi:formylglycine-generating enzyme